VSHAEETADRAELRPGSRSTRGAQPRASARRLRREASARRESAVSATRAPSHHHPACSTNRPLRKTVIQQARRRRSRPCTRGLRNGETSRPHGLTPGCQG
jgi:hypothetical protein